MASFWVSRDDDDVDGRTITPFALTGLKAEKFPIISTRLVFGVLEIFMIRSSKPYESGGLAGEPWNKNFLINVTYGQIDYYVWAKHK